MSRIAIGFLVGLVTVLCATGVVKAQEQPQQSEPMTMLVVPIQHGRAAEIAHVMNSVAHGVHFAWDDSSNSLVMSGRERDFTHALEVVKQLDVPRRDKGIATVGPHSFRVTVFYVEGNYDAEGPGGGSKLPAAIEPAAKVLAENGMYHLKLMTTQIFTIKGDEQFHAVGTLDDPAGHIRVMTRGQVRYSPAGRLAEVRCKSELARVGSQSTREVFSFETTLVTRLGEYTVIGASPMQTDGQKAVALILRVEGDTASKD